MATFQTTARRVFSLLGSIILISPFWVFPGIRTAVVPQTAQTQPEHPFFDIQAMDVDPVSRQMWIGTTSHGLIHLDLDSGEYETYTSADGLPADHITAVTVDQSPYVWVGTSDSGLARYNPLTGSWVTVNEAGSSALLSDRIHSLTVDAEGDLWVGTDSGASLIPSSSLLSQGYTFFGWHDCNPAGPACRPLWSYTVGDIAFAPDGDGWFAIDVMIIGISPKPGGVAQRDRQNSSAWNTWDMSQGMPTNQAVDIAVDLRGNVWAGSMNGLARYDQNDHWTSYTTATSSLIADSIEDLEFDAQDTLWVATQQGINRISAQGEWSRFTIRDGLPSNHVTVVKAFAGTVCFGTDIGIGCLDQANGEWHYFGNRTYPNYPAFLPLLMIG